MLEFFRKKRVATSIKTACKKSDVVEVWHFTREALVSPDSWTRLYSKDVKLISQFGGSNIWIELWTGACTLKVYPGNWLLRDSLGFFKVCTDADLKEKYISIVTEAKR